MKLSVLQNAVDSFSWFSLVKFLRALLLPPLSLQDETRDRLAWLALWRWVIVAGQLFCVFIAVQLEFVSLPLAPLLYSLIAGLGVFNLWACYSLNRGLGLLRAETSLLGWLLLDLMQFLLLLSLNQGIENPFYPLIYVHAVLGAVLLPTRLSWAFLTVMGTGLYLLNPVVYVFNDQQTFVRLSALVSWGIQFSVVGVVWGIAGWTSRRLLSWRHQAEALRERQQRLQRVHLLGALGAGVAHEFATPLNTLRMRLERIQRQAQVPPSDLQAALRALEQCETRLRSMAALPDQADLDRLSPVNLPQLLKKHLAAWQTKWPGIALDLDCPLPADFCLRLPELMLHQALDNLLNNAAQALQGQGPVQLRACTRQGQLQLEISDQGPGWPAHVLQHLGEPFVTTREEGTGLGLYTVYMLAQALGGSLSLHANTPKGASALLCLPLNL